MTNDEKFTAIIERTKLDKMDITPDMISVMAIVGYIDTLKGRGVVDSGFTVSPSGKSLCAICDEFEWTPSDKEVARFVIDMVSPEEQEMFFEVLVRYKNNPSGFLKEFEDSKKENPPQV